MLRGQAPRPEHRERDSAGTISVIPTARGAAPESRLPAAPIADGVEPTLRPPGRGSVIRIFPYGVSRSRLDKAIRLLHVPAALSKSWKDADAIVALKAHVRREPARLREAIESHKPTFVIRSNTRFQVEGVLREMFDLEGQRELEAEALTEAREAIERVLASGEPIELRSQSAPIRRRQHQLAEAARLRSYSRGADPDRHVCIARA